VVVFRWKQCANLKQKTWHEVTLQNTIVGHQQNKDALKNQKPSIILNKGYQNVCTGG